AVVAGARAARGRVSPGAGRRKRASCIEQGRRHRAAVRLRVSAFSRCRRDRVHDVDARPYRDACPGARVPLYARSLGDRHGSRGCMIDAATVIEDVLDTGASARFRASGDSMLPTIRPGDLLEVERVNPAAIRRGDVVLARLSRGLTAHRIVRIFAKGEAIHFVMRGDNTPEDDEP